MENCIFCKIIAGEIPSAKVYEDENMLAFKDINPQAKVHVLVVPKSHFATLAEMNAGRTRKKMFYENSRNCKISRAYERLSADHQPG